MLRQVPIDAQFHTGSTGPRKSGSDATIFREVAFRPFLTVQQNKNKTVLLFSFVYVLSDLSCTSPPVADKNK
jgi:hypothetical protein